ncbi:MAG: nucleotidyltransferase family protein [Geminicoccaceae bacterium]
MPELLPEPTETSSPPRDLDDLLGRLRAILPELRSRFGVVELGVFGSWARGEQRPESDVDLLVELARPVTFFEFLDLEAEIARHLGLPVEFVTRAALKPRIGAAVLRDLIPT